jgi:hypothetical protein
VNDRPMRVPLWDSVDDEVQSAVLRCRELAARSRRASDQAREASENVAAVVRDDEKRRSDAMASGADDPGRDTKAISGAEKTAEAASESARLLSAALIEAQRRLEVTCVQRSGDWQAAARTRMDDAAGDLTYAVEAVRRAYSAWIEAGQQVTLATSERDRRRGRVVSVDLPLDAHSDAGVVRVGAALDALAQLVAPAQDRAAVSVE